MEDAVTGDVTGNREGEGGRGSDVVKRKGKWWRKKWWSGGMY
jgi:hypothetical protein